MTRNIIDVDAGPGHHQSIQQKYDETNQKRRRADGADQYLEPAKEPDLRHLVADPWVDTAQPVQAVDDVLPTRYCRAIVLGAGPGALVVASRLIHSAGFKPEDVCIVDSAAGPGGTWYWNRYPGLMCDTDSLIYLPMLEETGYMPKHKYSYGSEIRQYCEQVVKHFGFKTLFQSVISSMDWDDEKSEWLTSITQHRTGKQPQSVRIRSQFVSIASGIISHPKLPRLPGLLDFQGDMFHTARWNYNVTGGSQENPNLEHLKDKVVGLVGTGATAVQVLPHLAKWCKKVYVFQRTPSSIDARNQRETDPEEFKRITSKPGWVADRHYNMLSTMMDLPENRPAVNEINDGWTDLHAYGALVGGPVGGEMTDMQQISTMYAEADFARSERVRARVDDIVKDKAVAEKLKAYYPGWCKRPCFHDDYLPLFNDPKVVLVDTNGKGVESVSKTGLTVNNTEYPLDVIVWSTGFRGPAEQAHQRGNMQVTGRHGASYDRKCTEKMATLHGVLSKDFPNLLLTGVSQAGGSPCYTYILDEQSRHIAHILREAEAKAGTPNFIIEPTAEAEEEWAQRVLSQTMNFAAMQGCLPSYFNLEGAVQTMMQTMSMEENMKMARASIWGKGCNDWVTVIRKWRNETNIEGVEVQVLNK